MESSSHSHNNKPKKVVTYLLLLINIKHDLVHFGLFLLLKILSL